MYTEEIEIDGIKFTLKIHIEKRKNVRASLRNNKINIRIPSFVEKKKREKYISHTIEKLKEQLRQNPELRPREKTFRKYHDGEILKMWRDEFHLQIKPSKTRRSTGIIEGDIIKISIADGLTPEEEHRHFSGLINRCVAENKQPELEAHVRELNDKYFKQAIKSVRLKNNKTNWGSCSKKGNINLSTRLLFAPDDVIDYVCIHELAHLIEMNHSPKFWKLVEEIVPDYKAKKQWLKTHGHEICF